MIRRLARQTLTAALVAAAVLTVAGPWPGVARAQDWEVSDSGRERKIVERLLELLERDPHNAYVFTQLRQRADALGGLEAVAARYAERAAADPSDTKTLVLLARLHQALGDAELALRYADQAASAGETGWQLYALRGVLHAETGDTTGAEADFESALQAASSKDDKIQILRELGDLARREDRIDDAVAAYLRIVDLDARDRYLRWELAAIFYEQGLWDQALEQYQAAADLAGRNVEERSRAELEIAGIYEKTGQYTEAIATYEAIIDRSAATHWLNRESRLRMVGAYRAAGDLDGLIARLDEHLERRPRDPWGLSLRAQLLEELGRDEDALQAWTRWYEDASRDDDEAREVKEAAWLRLLKKLRPRTEVAAVYEDLIDDASDDDQRLARVLDLVRFLRVTSDLPLEAYATLRAQEAHFVPDEDDRRGKRKRTPEDIARETDRIEELAVAYLQLGNNDDAVRRARLLYDEVLERDPGRVAVYLALLALAVDRGESETESALLDRIIALDTFDASVVEQLVEFYASRNQSDRVADILERALKNDPGNVELEFLRATQLPAGTRPGDALDAWRHILLASDDDHHLRTASRAYLELLEEHHVVGEVTDHYERGWAAAPQDWRQGRLLFFLYAWDGRVDDALSVLSTLQVQVDNPLTLEDQAFNLLQSQHPDEALTLLRTLARKRPLTAWRYHIKAGELLLARERPDAARDALERALDDASDNPDALGAAGDVYLRLGDIEPAIEVWDAAVKLAPRNPEHRLGLASALMARNATDDSRRAYQLLLDALPVTYDLQQADELVAAAIDAGNRSGLEAGRISDDLRLAADLVTRTEIADLVRQRAQTLVHRFEGTPL